MDFKKKDNILKNNYVYYNYDYYVLRRYYFDSNFFFFFKKSDGQLFVKIILDELNEAKRRHMTAIRK